MNDLKAPFPWFGGKSRVSELVWSRFGNVKNYIEPFFGSGAVLLGRPAFEGVETVNDLDGFVANLWRAIARDPEGVAEYAAQPVNEADLTAKHIWLLGQREAMTSKLFAGPDYYDVKIAGWWVWGLCAWIGGGWCSGEGPWTASDAGFLVKHDGQGASRKIPRIGPSSRTGVHKSRPKVCSDTETITSRDGLIDWLHDLSARLSRVRVVCGDWRRVLGRTVIEPRGGSSAIFLDPPYADTANRAKLYAVDSMTVAHSVREWAIEHGTDLSMRIALCGYEGEHVMPDTWECVPWKAAGGYGSQGNGQGRENAGKERVWFSPGCLRP